MNKFPLDFPIPKLKSVFNVDFKKYVKRVTQSYTL